MLGASEPLAKTLGVERLTPDKVAAIALYSEWLIGYEYGEKGCNEMKTQV